MVYNASCSAFFDGLNGLSATVQCMYARSISQQTAMWWLLEYTQCVW